MTLTGRIETIVLLLVMTVLGVTVNSLVWGEDRPHTTHFNFTKKGRLIARPSGMREPGPYFPTLVSMSKISDFPHDYALYFSTDHGRKGGIWLSVCTGNPTEASNWKSYDQAVAEGDFDYLKEKPVANPIFVDVVQGSQTETPHANVIDDTVYMTYHNAGAGHSQSTLLATSRDGVSFERINGDKDSVILDYDPETAPGNGHTGYFRWGPNPLSGVDSKYVGYSLHGGGDNFHSAIWASNDAINWERLDVLLPIEGHAIDRDRLLIWHEIDPNSIASLGDGEYIAISAGGVRASGAVARVSELYEIFLSADGRTLTRASRKILSNGATGADDEEELANPVTVVIGDTWYLLYVGTRGNAGVNTVLGASGSLNKTALKSAELKPSDRKRHLVRE